MSTAVQPMLPSRVRLQGRLGSVDLLRGLLMIIMALDHARDFFTNERILPTDPLQSWPALFATRWITHLCAPGFVALAGASVYLQRQRGRSGSQTAQRLVTRGLWLIFVELAIVDFAILLNYRLHLLEVIWVIGASMIVLAPLQRLPLWCVAAYGFLVVACHNFLDRFTADQFGTWSDLWLVLHQQGMVLLHGKPLALVAYPLLPWTGVMALGYAFGAIVVSAPEMRRRWCLIAAGLCLGLFTLLRTTNLYGDPVPFQHLPTGTQTGMSFLNVTKYPPSLQFLLVTLGVLLLLFALGDLLWERGWLKLITGVVEVYGRVPFFYFVVHLYVLHLLVIPVALVLASLRHAPWPQVDTTLPSWWGFSLPVVYAIWIAVVAVLYWPCRWFSRMKAERKRWWLSYL
jgi:uncharacterized membrane protein